jgi:hypothetical protein
MLTKTDYLVDPNLIQLACSDDLRDRIIINEPSGNFFYDPWQLKQEFVGTIWEKLYNSLPVVDKGEARIIVLSPADCYMTHADIDDRYHLNIQGDHCYLIDLDHKQMHFLVDDGIWYEMDAGRRHTAANFGRIFRVQLVIRKLLLAPKLTNPISIKLTPNIESMDHARYIFDDTVSVWLNSANKNNFINNFSFKDNIVQFEVESVAMLGLQSCMPKEFTLEIL